MISRENRNLFLASLGACLEYFDFSVYVFVAASVGLAFFPPGASPWLKQVQVFGIYALGYLVRPIAGIIIAHYADRIGRKKLFIFTVLLMSIPTFAMGLLPTYATIGWVAPALLLLLRILQGCAVGGELPGAAVFVSEHAARGRLGFSGGVFQAMTNCGLLMGTFAALLARQIAELDPSWSSLSWRLPFLFGGAFGLVAAYLRRSLSETPMFEEIRKSRQIARGMPLGTILRQYRMQCLFALTAVFVFSATSGVYFQFLPTYLISQMHFNPNLAFTANTLGVAVFILAMPAWGSLRDRFGIARTLGAATLANAGIAIWFFHLLPTLAPDSTGLIYAMIVVGLGAGCMHAIIPSMIASLFPTAIRQSGFAFPYSIGTAIFTGLTPLVLAWLSRDLGLDAPLYQYLLGCIAALVVMATIRFMPQYLGQDAIDLPAATPIEADGLKANS